MSSKAQQRIKKYKREGLSAEEIERRLAQSAQSKAVQSQNVRQQVKARTSKLVVREGDTAQARSRYEMINKRTRSYDMQMNEYLRSLAYPEKFTSLIPDPSTFPRGISQLRTVITASTWKSNTTPSGDDEIFLVCFPGLNNCFDGYHGRFEQDGVTYTDSAWDVHDYSSWSSTLQAFRPISMSVDVTYIGPALENKGQVAIACFPPHITTPTRDELAALEQKVMKRLREEEEEEDVVRKTSKSGTVSSSKEEKKKQEALQGPIGKKHVKLLPFENAPGADPALDFETVAEYNYSYSGAARNGAYQIWMPDSVRAFNSQAVTATMQASPYIVFAAKGLPLPEAGTGATWVTENPVFRVQVCLNIETYSVSQMLTANQQAGKPDALKMSHGLSTLAQAHINGNTAARGGSGDSVYSQIASMAKNAAGVIWDNRQLILPLAEGVAGLLA